MILLSASCWNAVLMCIMFYPLDHFLMRVAAITGNREAKVNPAFFLVCYGDDPMLLRVFL